MKLQCSEVKRTRPYHWHQSILWLLMTLWCNFIPVRSYRMSRTHGLLPLGYSPESYIGKPNRKTERNLHPVTDSICSLFDKKQCTKLLNCRRSKFPTMFEENIKVPDKNDQLWESINLVSISNTNSLATYIKHLLIVLRTVGISC